jgi:hypothetical protein
MKKCNHRNCNKILDANGEGVAKAEPKKGLFSFLKNIFK